MSKVFAILEKWLPIAQPEAQVKLPVKLKQRRKRGKYQRGGDSARLSPLVESREHHTKEDYDE